VKPGGGRPPFQGKRTGPKTVMPGAGVRPPVGMPSPAAGGGLLAPPGGPPAPMAPGGGAPGGTTLDPLKAAMLAKLMAGGGGGGGMGGMGGPSGP
jgi:hypothetical protein